MLTTILTVIVVIGVLTIIGDGNPFAGAAAATILITGLGVFLAALAAVALFVAWGLGYL